MKHTISVLVENKPGVLARIAGLFSARGYNITSLTVGETEDPAVSCMTIVADAADQRVLEQIMKQLNKLIDIISVRDLTKKEFYDRELVLVKVNYSAQIKPRLAHLANKYPAKVLRQNDDFAVIEACGDQHQIKGLIESLREFGVKELVRTGRIAMTIEDKAYGAKRA